MDRRVQRIERIYRPGGIDCALLERIAGETDIEPDELLARGYRTLAAIGPPYTIERMAAHAAKADGLTPGEEAELVDRSYRLLEHR